MKFKKIYCQIISFIHNYIMSEKEQPNKDDEMIKEIAQYIKEISEMVSTVKLDSLYNLTTEEKKYFKWIKDITSEEFCKQLDLFICSKNKIDDLENFLKKNTNIENKDFSIEKLKNYTDWLRGDILKASFDILKKNMKKMKEEYEKMKKDNDLLKKLFSRQTQNDGQLSRLLKCNSIEYYKIKLLNENLINLNNKYFEELELYKKEVRKRYPRIKSKIENIIKQKELKKKKENDKFSLKINNIINLPGSQNKYNNNKKLEKRLKLPPIDFNKKFDVNKVFAHPKGIQGIQNQETYFDKDIKLKEIHFNKKLPKISKKITQKIIQ